MLRYLGAVLVAAALSEAKRPKAKTEIRRLLLTTCETDIELYNSLAPLRVVHPSLQAVVNVCDGVAWTGFHTKVNAVKKFVDNHANRRPQDVILFFDARDSILNDLTEAEALQRFDDVRGSGSLVFGCEMGCYVGEGFNKGCTAYQHAILRNGSGLTKAPPEVYSRFLNSGIYMGTASSLSAFLTESVFGPKGMLAPRPTRRMAPLRCPQVDDQCQFATYVLNHPQVSVLDYRQELIGTFSLMLRKADVYQKWSRKSHPLGVCHQREYHWSCLDAVGSCCTHPRVPRKYHFDVSQPCRLVRPEGRLASHGGLGGVWKWATELHNISFGTEGLAKGHKRAPLIWHAAGLVSGSRFVWDELMRVIFNDKCRLDRLKADPMPLPLFKQKPRRRPKGTR